MLTLLAYLNYAKNPKPARYLAVLILFALGLMSKPMLVTLPFVMLLLDYWPLCRVQGNLSSIQSLPPGKLTRTVHCPKLPFRRLLGEKVPLLALAILSCIVTYLVQQKSGAMLLRQMGHAPLMTRMSNMLVAYFEYVRKMVYPVNLSLLYPFPEEGLPVWKPILALLFLAAISIFVVVQLRRRPYLLVGWLWFLGTLVPVTGLIQVGVQSMADRYTYIPYTGLFIIVSWGLPDIFRKWRLKKVVLCIMATSSIVAMTLCTARQVGYWKNGLALFGHALDATKNNYVMSFSLALEFAARGRTDKAIEYHQKALQINPSYTYSSINLGYIYESSGHLDKAIDYYRQATEADPESVPAWINLGNSFKAQGKHDEAIKHYRRALEIEPDRSYTHYNLALTLTAHDKIDEAVHHYRQAIRLNTDDYRSHSNLGSILLSRGMTDQAVGHFKRALEIKPGFAAARSNLNRAVQMKADQSDSAPEKQPETAREWNDYGLDLASSGNLDKALDCFLKAVELDPQLAEAYNNIGNVFFMRKKNGQAIEYYRKVIELSPNHPLAHYNLALALEGEGKNEEAAKHLQKHLEINPGSEAAMKKLEQLMNSPKRDR
ncbi:tetratricopeptide repeat protein, partial [Candidatus Pacearchaeota archaeon]|nr:tetratricopeptide repeat protein [Candidatus Pacearchaeota archaeon]